MVQAQGCDSEFTLIKNARTDADADALSGQQIKCLLAYQYMKDNDVDPKESGANNPYRVLFHELTGVSLKRPRLRTTVNVWRRANRTAVEEESLRWITLAGFAAPKRRDLAAFRDKVVRDLFADLGQEERDQWAEQAKEEHEAALLQWKKDIEEPPSKDPAARQRCIQRLVTFVQPVLDAIADATGWTTTLIAGRPEPSVGGRLSIVGAHSGCTARDVKMDFGCAERQRYEEIIIPIYASFLRKCYTLDECLARALPVEDGFVELPAPEFDADRANFDSIPTLPSAPSHPSPLSSPAAAGLRISANTASISEPSAPASPTFILRPACPITAPPAVTSAVSPPSSAASARPSAPGPASPSRAPIPGPSQRHSPPRSPPILSRHLPPNARPQRSPSPCEFPASSLVKREFQAEREELACKHEEAGSEQHAPADHQDPPRTTRATPWWCIH